MPQRVDKKRINPRQKRARQTIDTIMEATAQVLERSGGSDFTTNHIARRAGFSIGTLYRYFPHKKAILREMVESTLRQQDLKIRNALAQSDGASAEEIIELAVQSMLEPFLNRSRVRVHMIRALIQDADFVETVNAVQLQMVRRFQSKLIEIDPVRYREPTDLSCLVLAGALLGSIRMTLFTEPAYLSDPDYKRELIALVTHLVTAKDLSSS